jgi:hypothetical protein
LIVYCRNWQPGATISAPAELFKRTRQQSATRRST